MNGKNSNSCVTAEPIPIFGIQYESVIEMIATLLFNAGDEHEKAKKEKEANVETVGEDHQRLHAI